MAESSSPALPGDIEWLPGPGGGRVLRIHPSSAEPPALILRLAGGGEERVDARPSPATEYEIPGTLQWSAAWLQWPDGTRAAIPLPHGPHAEVIELRPRRERGAHTEGESAALRDDIAAPREDAARSREPASPRHDSAPAGAASGEASERAEEAPVLGTLPAHSRAGAWTTPPQVNPAMGDAEAQWKARRAEVAHELGEAAAAIARARDGERSARDAVLAALATARADLRAARAAREADASTLAALTGELGAERAAHAVTRGSIGTLADALSTARAELAEAKTREEAARAAIAAARAELTAARATGEAELVGARHEVTAARAAVASLREALEAERAARAAAEAALSERDDRPDVLQRVADLAAPRDQADLERRAREQADAAATAERRPAEEAATLLANLDAAAAALRAAVKPDGESPAATSPAADSSAAAGSSSAAAPPAAAGSSNAAAPPAAASAAAGSSNAAAPPADPSAAAESSGGAGVPAAAEPSGGAVSPAAAGAESSAGVPTAAVAASSSSTDLVPARGDGRLRRALVGLAREDAVAAGALLVGLLPAQGAVLHGTLTYDLTVRGVGTFAVFVEDGSARVVRLSRRRPRGQAPFHLSAEPLALAELLAGERRKVGRFRRKAKVSGRRKRAQELTALRDARLSLADAVEAGARLEPALVFQALPFVVEPEWTCGHRFTVAQQIVELAPREWHVAVHDGRPLRVVERSAGAPADATVTMTRAAFDRLLRDERPALADRPVVRGDREAVAALKRWTDLARGV